LSADAQVIVAGAARSRSQPIQTQPAETRPGFRPLRYRQAGQHLGTGDHLPIRRHIAFLENRPSWRPWNLLFKEAVVNASSGQRRWDVEQEITEPLEKSAIQQMFAVKEIPLSIRLPGAAENSGVVIQAQLQGGALAQVWNDCVTRRDAQRRLPKTGMSTRRMSMIDFGGRVRIFYALTATACRCRKLHELRQGAARELLTAEGVSQA